YVRLGQAYAAALSAIEGVTVMPGFGQDWAGTTCNVEFTWPDTGKVARYLVGAGIESGHWWARGCHQHEAFAACSSTPLEVTRHLADHTLALPFHLRLGPAELNRIVMSLAASLGDAGEALDERTVAQAG
ncbi:MAG: DegT/DnrJ/EryC1/StrS family aminotransferase, partial [Alphaproteobacteria bacterium]